MTDPHKRSDWSFLIPAAGHGLRLGKGDKYLLELNGEPLWLRAVKQALHVSDDVLLAVPPEAVADVQQLDLACRVIAGAETRHQTLEKLSQLARHHWVMVHDVARPFASTALMLRVARAAEQFGFTACGTPLEPPFAQAEGEGYRLASMGLNRPVSAHTPLACRREELVSAYALVQSGLTLPTSTLELMALAGHLVHIEENERWNLKITHTADWAFANLIAATWDSRP